MSKNKEILLALWREPSTTNITTQIEIHGREVVDEAVKWGSESRLVFSDYIRISPIVNVWEYYDFERAKEERHKRFPMSKIGGMFGCSEPLNPWFPVKGNPFNSDVGKILLSEVKHSKLSWLRTEFLMPLIVVLVGALILYLIHLIHP